MISDDWLDEHPKIDRLINRSYIWRRAPRDFIRRLRAKREWRPGSFYLDHGNEPCVLVRLHDDMLTGVSLVDGRLIGGCSIYACGPEHVTEEEARQRADRQRALKELVPDEGYQEGDF